MRVSIWQQFSSNHSNGFEVVGKFDTIESAQEATEKLRLIVLLISQYRIGYIDRSPTYAELVFAQEYGIENWDRSLDWAFDENIQVIQFDQYVYCGDVITETWLGAHPIETIMKKLGAEVVVYEEMRDRLVAVELTCKAPDNIAKSLEDELEHYLKMVREEKVGKLEPPWRAHSVAINEGNYPDYYADHAYYGYVERKGRNFRFTKMTFAETGYGLPALLAYLRANGCSDIEYKIEEKNSRAIYND